MNRIARASSVGLLCACALTVAACGDDDDVDDNVDEIVDTVQEGINDLQDDSTP